ncbi:MAG: DUF4476 domain-containing protein [Gloeobacteraceae cyanobacterium ES-bin-316]|nr:DUF4476 domain-containing protein [Ferruginibacter sp.]
MRSLFLVISLLFLALISEAQQYHFIYLQTDNKQPFYVRVKEKLYSSSPSGYVVVPKLAAGPHTLSVGFPKNEWPVQNIDISIANNDMGFVLKNFENKGWGLFNLQTMEVINTSAEKNISSPNSMTTKTDEFSNVLADVVNTPSIKEEKKEIKPVIAAEVSKATPLEPEKVTVQEVAPVFPIPAPVQVVKTDVAAPVIQKLSTSSDNEGVVVVYLDKLIDRTDTIKIFIEAPITLIPELPVLKDTVVVEKIEREKTAEQDREEKTKPSPKFIDISLPNPNDKAKESESKQEDGLGASETKPSTTSAPTMINSDCKQMATEEDFLKIRKRMTAEKGDDEMVKAAVKMFKQKCYSTEQLKNLSELFLKDDGKYKLFDAAYPYVYDSQSFRQLESQLTDAYIITRFRAMIRN